MGKERDKLIKAYGGTPFSESGKTIRQAGITALAEALARGELPDALSGPVPTQDTTTPRTTPQNTVRSVTEAVKKP